MRIRPFFWFLLVLSCASVLIFAATTNTYAPASMQVHIQRHPAPAGFTTLELHLTDFQGLPIERAQISSSASMTNMYMFTRQSRVQELGQGNYIAQMRLYMTGPWEITVMASAQGFTSLQQKLLVQVM